MCSLFSLSFLYHENKCKILTLSFVLDQLNLFSISQKDLYFQCMYLVRPFEFRLELFPSDPLSVTLNQVWAEFSYFWIPGDSDLDSK